MSPKLSTAKKRTARPKKSAGKPAETVPRVQEPETKISGVKKAAKVAQPKPAKKTSALDGAARVLAESGEPLTAGQMIEAMAAKGYWSSPAGRTPALTLDSGPRPGDNQEGGRLAVSKSGTGQVRPGRQGPSQLASPPRTPPRPPGGASRRW